MINNIGLGFYRINAAVIMWMTWTCTSGVASFKVCILLELNPSSAGSKEAGIRTSAPSASACNLQQNGHCYADRPQFVIKCASGVRYSQRYYSVNVVGY